MEIVKCIGVGLIGGIFADVQAELDKARVPGLKSMQVVRVDGSISQGSFTSGCSERTPMEIQILGKKYTPLYP